jgi:hypothetical protein
MLIQGLLVLSILFASNVNADEYEAESAFSRSSEVLQIYTKLLGNKTLKSENGSILQFDVPSNCSSERVCIPYKQTFASGRVAAGFEIMTLTDASAVMEQYIYGTLARKYLASVVGPLKVLRIQPLQNESTDFISRDCIFTGDEKLTVCYVKVRFLEDVIVTVFREVK